jgi:hypothetical protein
VPGAIAASDLERFPPHLTARHSQKQRSQPIDPPPPRPRERASLASDPAAARREGRRTVHEPSEIEIDLVQRHRRAHHGFAIRLGQLRWWRRLR